MAKEGLTFVWVRTEVCNANLKDDYDWIETYVDVPYSSEYFNSLKTEQKKAICQVRLLEKGIVTNYDSIFIGEKSDLNDFVDSNYIHIKDTEDCFARNGLPTEEIHDHHHKKIESILNGDLNFSSSFHKLFFNLDVHDVDSLNKIAGVIDNTFQYITTKTICDDELGLNINIVDNSGTQKLFFRDIINLAKVISSFNKKMGIVEIMNPYILLDNNESYGVLDIRTLYEIAKLKREERKNHPAYSDIEKIINNWYNCIKN